MTPELEEYLLAHSTKQSALLQYIEQKTNQLTTHPHMLSGTLQGELLRMFSLMIKPRRILEIGTFTGYSANCLLGGLAGDGELHTIEKNDELEDFLSEVLLDERIHLHIGDAKEVLKQLIDSQFDVVFIDADKREYVEYYNLVFPMVRPGGWILADNTVWDGHIIDPLYNNDKQTQGLQHFNDLIAGDDRVEKLMLPMRDGITLIYKKP